MAVGIFGTSVLKQISVSTLKMACIYEVNTKVQPLLRMQSEEERPSWKNEPLHSSFTSCHTLLMPWWLLVLGAEPNGDHGRNSHKSWVWHLSEYPTHWQTDSFCQTTEVIKLEKLSLLKPLPFLQDEFLLSFFWVFNLQNWWMMPLTGWTLSAKFIPLMGINLLLYYHVLRTTCNWNSAENTDLIFLWPFFCGSPIAVPTNFVKSNEYFFQCA